MEKTEGFNNTTIDERVTMWTDGQAMTETTLAGIHLTWFIWDILVSTQKNNDDLLPSKPYVANLIVYFP